MRMLSIALGIVAAAATTACSQDMPDFEYVYLPGTEIGSGANLPFTPAMRVRGGNIIFLSGVTGAPVPHSHPHVPSEFDHLDFSAEAQTRAKFRFARIQAAYAKLSSAASSLPSYRSPFGRSAWGEYE